MCGFKVTGPEELRSKGDGAGFLSRFLSDLRVLSWTIASRSRIVPVGLAIRWHSLRVTLNGLGSECQMCPQHL